MSHEAFFENFFRLEQVQDSNRLIGWTKDEFLETWQRLCYIQIGNVLTFIDVPFAVKSEVQNLVDELGAHGLGQSGQAYTYHVVVPTTSIQKDPEGVAALLGLMMRDALAAESRIRGVQAPDQPNQVLNTDFGDQADSDMILAPAQQTFLISKMRELEAFVEKYQVSAEILEFEDAQELSMSHPKRVLSIDPEARSGPSTRGVMALESPLLVGFEEDSEIFFESRVDCLGDNGECPFTEVVFECSHCEGDPEVASKCKVCFGEGQLIFDLNWDDNGKVSASRTL